MAEKYLPRKVSMFVLVYYTLSWLCIGEYGRGKVEWMDHKLIKILYYVK